MMKPQPQREKRILILKEAQAFGASLAGMASVDSLRRSPCYRIYDQSPYYDGNEKVVWPEEARSVLAFALFHDPSDPGLDWWDYEPGIPTSPGC